MLSRAPGAATTSNVWDVKKNPQRPLHWLQFRQLGTCLSADQRRRLHTAAAHRIWRVRQSGEDLADQRGGGQVAGGAEAVGAL